jgi:UDP-3-O-[3-hydroxymyristoyl] glucosamine N-acyltransferase
LTHPLLIGDHATVEDGVGLGPQTIIGHGVHIHKDASVVGTIVFDNVEIGSKSSIEGAVIGNSVRIGKGVMIQWGSVIAGHVNIRDNVHITRDVYVHPHREVAEDINSPGHVV